MIKRLKRVFGVGGLQHIINIDKLAECAHEVERGVQQTTVYKPTVKKKPVAKIPLPLPPSPYKESSANANNTKDTKNTHTNIILSPANVVVVHTPNGEEHKLTLVDSSHFGEHMQDVLHLLKEVGCTVDALSAWEDGGGDGYVNQDGDFYTSSEALIIVKESGQPFNEKHQLPNRKLDSYSIRHFEGDVGEYVSRKEGSGVGAGEGCGAGRTDSEDEHCCIVHELTGSCNCKWKEG